jgi:hypothetical protein
MPRIFDGPFPRPISLKTAELVYLISEAETELIARDFLLDNIPSIYDKKGREDFTVDPLPLAGFYRATVRYRSGVGELAGEGETGESSGIRFSTFGGSRILQTSKETRQMVHADGETKVIDFDLLINVDENGAVRGTEVSSSEFTFEIPKRMSPEQLTDAAVASWLALKEHINDKPYKGFLKGEVLFLGAEGAQTGAESEVVFRFKARPNSTHDWPSGVTIAGMAGVAFEGWDYVWVYYRTETITRTDGSKVESSVPKQVNVERIYDYGDLSLLPV